MATAPASQDPMAGTDGYILKDQITELRFQVAVGTDMPGALMLLAGYILKAQIMASMGLAMLA